MAGFCRQGRPKVKAIVGVLVVASMLYLAIYSAGIHQVRLDKVLSSPGR